MTEWNRDLASYRMEKAKETLEDANVLASSGRWDACVNRLYYACFYAVSALLIYNGHSSSKHTGVRSLFNFHFVKTGVVSKEMARIYNDLFERRHESDYMDFISFSRTQVLPWVSNVEKFVTLISSLLKKKKT